MSRGSTKKNASRRGGGFSGPFEGEALLTAAKNDDGDGVRALVQIGGIPVTWSNRAGQTALHVAALWASTEAIGALVSLGARVNAKNSMTGATPLHLAAIAREGRAKKLETIRALLDAGADPEAPDAMGAPAWFYAPDEETRVAMGGPVFKLHKAIMHGDLPKLKRLLRDLKYPDQINEADTDGNTPLHIAAMTTLTKAVKVLLAAGAEPDETNEDGATPLHIAVAALHQEIARLLLDAKASPNIRSLQIDEYHSQRSDWVVIDGTDAVERGQSFSLSSRGRKSLEKRTLGCEHNTPLHIAAHLGSVDMATLLLDHGASVDLPDVDGKTALHLALENLADADGPSETGKAEELVRLLLDHGADTSKGNKDFGRYRTTLHWAAMHGHVAALQLLLDRGRDSKAAINNKDQQGFTALMLAARGGKAACVELLLRHGADTSAVNAQGMGVRELAELNGKAGVLGVIDGFAARHGSSSSG